MGDVAELPTLALSLIQPWAWAVIHGPKDIENRTWWSIIRGPVWIAASAQVTRRYYDQARELMKGIAGIDCPKLDELEYGKIIGSANIVDCILPGGYTSAKEIDCRSACTAYKLHGARWGSDRATPLRFHPRDRHPWHFVEQYGYVLADRVPVAKPVPCKGHQRWWRVPTSVLEQLNGFEKENTNGSNSQG